MTHATLQDQDFFVWHHRSTTLRANNGLRDFELRRQLPLDLMPAVLGEVNLSLGKTRQGCLQWFRLGIEYGLLEMNIPMP